MCITCYYEVSLRCLARFRGFSPDAYLKVVQLCQSSSPIIRNFDQGANGMYIYILTLFFVPEEILAMTLTLPSLDDQESYVPGLTVLAYFSHARCRSSLLPVNTLLIRRINEFESNETVGRINWVEHYLRRMIQRPSRVSEPITSQWQ